MCEYFYGFFGINEKDYLDLFIGGKNSENIMHESKLFY